MEVAGGRGARASGSLNTATGPKDTKEDIFDHVYGVLHSPEYRTRFASELLSDPAKDFLVQKITFGRKDKQVDKTTIHYNARIALTGIPLEAYDYAVNGKPALEWIMERYQITVDKDSGLRNDPNDWAREHNQPRYILDLLKRIVRVSLETMKIVNTLPALNDRK